MATATAAQSSHLRRSLQDILSIQQQHVCARAVLRKHRQGDRFPLNMPLPASSETPDGNRLRKPFKVFALDVGPKGIGLVANRAFSRGDDVYVSFAPLGLDELVFPTRVVHCSEMLPGVFRLGVEFNFLPTC
jgi:hypothetical protein